MKHQSLLLRFLMTLVIWFFAIFIMAVVIFFFMRLLVFYWIGGDFLFSRADIVKALKIGAYCSLLCSVGTWLLYWRNKC
ncbi:hypothetical protein HX37_25565 [Salmonella enterica]|uniref:Uncharacterized protein n=1 Tax=Salmonella enterica TaxID=28901 RepID=A0A5U2FAH3_SALER|nr:hypothetical protein [Salmonella enterica]